MTLYLTPAEDMKTYLDEMKYKDQRVTQKMIGVDTAKYMLEIDGRSDEIHTGGEGCWGKKQTLSVCARWPATFSRSCSRWTEA